MQEESESSFITVYINPADLFQNKSTYRQTFRHLEGLGGPNDEDDGR